MWEIEQDNTIDKIGIWITAVVEMNRTKNIWIVCIQCTTIKWCDCTTDSMIPWTLPQHKIHILIIKIDLIIMYFLILISHNSEPIMSQINIMANSSLQIKIMAFLGIFHKCRCHKFLNKVYLDLLSKAKCPTNKGISTTIMETDLLEGSDIIMVYFCNMNLGWIVVK